MHSHKLAAVDLFAGAGGFSLGALNSGFDVVFAIENDKHSSQTYRENISRKSGTVLYEEDIETLNSNTLAAKHFGENHRCDVLLGGPPCQGFSTHRILNAGVDDPRNKLIHAYFEFVRALRPRVFLMENVPGILWQRHEKYLNKFYQQGREANYHLFQPVKLDARDYGVPQRRHRVFILGVEKSFDTERLEWPPSPTHSEYGSSEKDPFRSPWISCKDAFSKAPKADINNVHMNHGAELVAAFENTPKNGGSRKDSGRLLPCHSEHDGHKDTYGRINPYVPAPTMTTACINPSKGRFVHPTRNHGITARQAARIQTFPDDFEFHGGLIAAGRQIGNAVPVTLAEALLGALIDAFSSNVPAVCHRSSKTSHSHLPVTA